MNNILKLFIGLFVLVLAVSLIYVIAKNTFKRSDLIFKDGIRYYTEQKYELAEQSLQHEADKGNKDAYAFLGHTKLMLHKLTEAEKYLLQALNNVKKNDDENKPIILCNLGSVYINLKDYAKAKKYLLESSNLGNKQAEKMLIEYNLNN